MPAVNGYIVLESKIEVEFLVREFFITEEHYNTLKRFFPEGYQVNINYTVFIKILSYVLQEVRPFIDSFTDLVDVDKCPSKFLPLLGSLIGYDYNYNLSSRANRFIIKYTLEAYRRRGTEEALKLVNRIAQIDEREDEVPDEEKYFHYIFDPNISEDENKLYLPRRRMFRWGSGLQGFYSSKYSTNHAYPSVTNVPEDKLPGRPPIDWYFNDAIFDVYAPEVTALLRELMKWVIPAGMRTYWTMIYNMKPADFAKYLAIDTDLQVITGETYRYIYFIYEESGDPIAKTTDYFNEDLENLFDTTYSFDKVVSNIKENTRYRYRLAIDFPNKTEQGVYETKSIMGEFKDFSILNYSSKTHLEVSGVKHYY